MVTNYGGSERLGRTMTEEIGTLSPNASGLFALVIDDQEAVGQFIAKALAGLGVDSKT
jgi:hypothetical protein